jgi:hypothetical protein
MIDPEGEEPFLAGLEKAIREIEKAVEPWTQQLESKFGPKPFVRPFICDGPLTSCNVFIVGVNPRENMEFQKFWACGKYNKSAWEKEYLWKRYKGDEGAITEIIAGCKPGAIVSKTRMKIEIFCHSVGRPVLETNIYPVATDTETKLRGHPGKDETIVKLLLERLRPHVVIAHGNTARSCISRLLEVEKVIAYATRPAEFTEVRSKDRTRVTHLIALKQLGGRAGGRYGYDFMRGLGSHVRDVLLNGQEPEDGCGVPGEQQLQPVE